MIGSNSGISKSLCFVCRVITVLAVTFAVMCCSGCDKRPATLYISSETYRYEPGEGVDYASLVKRAETTTKDKAPETDTPVTVHTPEFSDIPSNTEEPSEVNSDSESGSTVYWVSGGEVWHTTKECSSLSRSKSILSGTIDEAKASGKERVCKRCGD